MFAEDSVFRIDHYLGKETVQNILAFRFANSIFEPMWNTNLIDSVQITVAEDIGIEGRGAYYDKAGAMRDIIQNHGLQLVALTAMEPPLAFDANAVRDEKVKVLRAIRPLIGEDIEQSTVRGQYTKGWVLGEQGAKALDVTLSIGLAALGQDDTAASILKRADQALYRAKRDGRNRVVADAA